MTALKSTPRDAFLLRTNPRSFVQVFERSFHLVSSAGASVDSTNACTDLVTLLVLGFVVCVTDHRSR